MKKVRIAFFDARPYDKRFFEQANKTFSFSIKYFESHLGSDTAMLTQGFTVVCVFVNDEVDADVIRQCKDNGVELIALRCAGYNNVDFKSAFQKIHIVRVPEYSPYAVAEHALALILTLNRKTHKAFYRTRDNNFNINGLLGFDMHGKTIGIIGTGKIGKILIKILGGFGMRILAYDLYPDHEFAEEAGCGYVSLSELFRQSDIISLHCPLNQDTYHIINKDTLHEMKDGVMIINTGRGRLIDTAELVEALKSGKVGTAGLDVYEEEGAYFFEDYSSMIINDDILARLLSFSNVLITSHQGFFTQEALSNIAETTLQNISDFINDKPLANEICYQCSKPECRKKESGRCF